MDHEDWLTVSTIEVCNLMVADAKAPLLETCSFPFRFRGPLHEQAWKNEICNRCKSHRNGYGHP